MTQVELEVVRGNRWGALLQHLAHILCHWLVWLLEYFRLPAHFCLPIILQLCSKISFYLHYIYFIDLDGLRWLLAAADLTLCSDLNFYCRWRHLVMRDGDLRASGQLLLNLYLCFITTRCWLKK